MFNFLTPEIQHYLQGSGITAFLLALLGYWFKHRLDQKAALQVALVAAEQSEHARQDNFGAEMYTRWQGVLGELEEANCMLLVYRNEYAAAYYSGDDEARVKLKPPQTVEKEARQLAVETRGRRKDG